MFLIDVLRGVGELAAVIAERVKRDDIAHSTGKRLPLPEGLPVSPTLRSCILGDTTLLPTLLFMYFLLVLMICYLLGLVLAKWYLLGREERKILRQIGGFPPSQQIEAFRTLCATYGVQYRTAEEERFELKDEGYWD
ncbi:hypothetical protein EG329_006586 [Mollisiaceae sp. DMI_Dod_QoI]|nr:hypothetical protein EG329_006586 [Helotiales sp. DMI_Dod_QoI]